MSKPNPFFSLIKNATKKDAEKKEADKNSGGKNRKNEKGDVPKITGAEFLDRIMKDTGNENLSEDKQQVMLKRFRKALLELNSKHIVKSKVKTENYFKFCLFGKFWHIGSLQFTKFCSAHDFVYTYMTSILYFFIYYLFSKGPMYLTAAIGFSLAIFSLIFGTISIIFKFSLTTTLSTLKFSKYKVYFYSKLLYTLVAFLLNLYFMVALWYRKFIQSVSFGGEKGFFDGRREMSSNIEVTNRFLLLGPIFLCNSFHLLQNFYWIRLLNDSLVDLVTRVKHKELSEDK